MTNLNQLLRIFVFLWPTLFFPFSRTTVLDSPLSVNLPLSPHLLHRDASLYPIFWIPFSWETYLLRISVSHVFVLFYSISSHQHLIILLLCHSPLYSLFFSLASFLQFSTCAFSFLHQGFRVLFMPGTLFLLPIETEAAGYIYWILKIYFPIYKKSLKQLNLFLIFITNID